MKIYLFTLLIILIVGSLFGCSQKSNIDQNMPGVGVELQSADLYQKFSIAYSNQPVNAAIYEGTNLVSFLNDNWHEPLTPSECARLSLIHARLSKLYNEAGRFDCAFYEADQASRWVRAIVNNITNSPSEVVSNLLAKDDIQRNRASN